MKGLRRPVGIHENVKVAAKTVVAVQTELANKIEIPIRILQQIMHIRLFHKEQADETGAIEIEVNEDYFTQSIQ